jgi:hypothetical protein
MNAKTLWLLISAATVAAGPAAADPGAADELALAGATPLDAAALDRMRGAGALLTLQVNAPLSPVDPCSSCF